jgi:hypothetical protein
MIKLQKLISGGQAGADRAGLDAAKALGIPTGGTAPKGWRICLPDGSDGSDPSLAELGLVEHALREYPPRTRQNVADSDGTVWFGYVDSPGGKLTVRTCRKLKKPYLVEPKSVIEFIDWVEPTILKFSTLLVIEQAI